MHKTAWLGLVLLLALCPAPVQALAWRKDNAELNKINKRIAGKVIDHTANHGADHRIWSRALGQRRDLYVYLPPGFQTDVRYPLLIYLHGFGQDEQSFLHHVVPLLDKAIASCALPPLIAAAPDGSFNGEPCHCQGGSFFLNALKGDYEDFVVDDVWDFVVKNYPIRCEREAHILAGVSMGGFAAYNLGIKHREAFGVVAGICPPLNLRWIGRDGNYQANFDPNNWGWRTQVDRSREVIASFFGGTVKIRLRDLLDPVFGQGPDAIWSISRENPIEMIDRYGIREGELAMFVAYNGKDEYNIDAQVESFLYWAKCRGLTVAATYDANGKHLMPDMARHLPAFFEWLAPRLSPYSPVGTIVPVESADEPKPAGTRK
jgi:S-formylglutathione hydrolase FrmB